MTPLRLVHLGSSINGHLFIIYFTIALTLKQDIQGLHKSGISDISVQN